MKDMWLARDMDDTLWLFINKKPIKQEDEWQNSNNLFLSIDDDLLFPEVQWSDDEPTKVKLEIDK